MLHTLKSITAELEKLPRGEVLTLHGLDEDVYHSVEAVGSTLLKSFIEAPAKYLAAIGAESKQTDALRFGSLAHCLVLEGHLFSTKFAVSPEGIDRRTKQGKLDWKAFEERSEGKTLIKPDEFKKAKALANSVDKSKGQYFRNGEAEISYFKKDLETGLILKSRVDYMVTNEKDTLAIDFKTTVCSEPNAFIRASFNLMYYIQAALYLEVTGCDMFAFIAAEKEAPYLTAGPFILGEEVLEFGQIEMRNALNRLAACKRDDIWPGYDQPGVITIELPGYMSARYEELLNENQTDEYQTGTK